jgi:hypothetical protein
MKLAPTTVGRQLLRTSLHLRVDASFGLSCKKMSWICLLRVALSLVQVAQVTRQPAGLICHRIACATCGDCCAGEWEEVEGEEAEEALAQLEIK